MDAVVAERMTRELVGHEIGEWHVLEYVNCGKSALVFRARHDDKIAALKVFDPDLVQRFGKASQLARIEREKVLVGKGHPNLVSIFDGGECSSTGYLFVAMDFVEAPNLASALKTIPRDRIRSVMSQVAAAAEFLEGQGLVHRDIKPDNIVITEGWARTVLLDLGVLRPLAGSDLTDETHNKPFIGTLRYASPEHLLRHNDDTLESWRALTFYQLGAVLYDLIMRQPLFTEYSEPYPRLVQAVLHTVPTMNAPDVDPELTSLAKDCLVKSPEHRLRFVTWERFQFRQGTSSLGADARLKLARRRTMISVEAPAGPDKHDHTVFRSDVVNQLVATTRQLCITNPDLPPVEVRGEVTADGGTCVVMFPLTESFGLTQDVVVRFSLRIVDYVDSSVEIEVDAFAGAATSGGMCLSVFQGVLEWGRVRLVVDGVICATVAQAQEEFESGARDIPLQLHGGGDYA